MATPVVEYDIALLARDLAERGLLATDLARMADCSDKTVSRFLRGHTQTAKMAGRFARALGYSPRRYVLRVRVPA